MKYLFITLLMFVVTSIVSGCTNANLSPLSSGQAVGYGSLNANFCTSPAVAATQNLKYLFILDHSASNAPGFPNPLEPNDVTNTDPVGSRRYGPLINFVNSLAAEANPNTMTSFALIDFSDQAQQVVGTGGGFDTSASDFINNVVTPDWICQSCGGTAQAPAPNDTGFTNYVAALNLALQLIQQDALAQTAENNGSSTILTSYQIIFVSDGYPLISMTNATPPVYVQNFETDIQPVISNILNLKNDLTIGPSISSIQLNTAYYYNTVQLSAAETILQQMATAGSGQYIQFGSGANILYQQFTPPSSQIVNQLADVFVQNQNGIWWNTGEFMADTDGDGLPDAIEKQFGSNPNVADSDGNGVSDFVEYVTKGKPCDDAQCSAAGRDPYAMCGGFGQTTSADGTVTFQSSAKDGLNDCERYLLGGQFANFNSSGNLIPDFFAATNTLPITIGSSKVAFADPFGDDISNYDKLKLNLPIQVSMKSVNGFVTRSTNLTVSSQSSSQESCYNLQVSNIAVAPQIQNTLKVMIVENSSAVQNKPILYVAQKVFDQNLTVNLQAGDFK